MNGLRDVLWRLLFEAGSLTSRTRPIEVQLSLALAALAVQCDEKLWPDPIGMAASHLGSNPRLVLDFIAHVPEQLMNRLIPLSVQPPLSIV